MTKVNSSHYPTDELSQPGMLYVLLANIDLGFRYASYQRQHYSMGAASRVAWRRRCMRSLRHTRLFPLFNGPLVSLDELAEGGSLMRQRNPLIIPPKPPSSGDSDSMSSYRKELPYFVIILFFNFQGKCTLFEIPDCICLER